MCGISASFNLDTLLELIDINNKRGTFSFSLLVYNTKKEAIEAIYQSFSDSRPSIIEYYKQLNNKDLYYISHSQAPTSTDIGLTEDITRIHPAKLDNRVLYHNGILKEKSINQLQLKYGLKENWDTKLLLTCIDDSYNNLNQIEGSYACIDILKDIKIFRNESSILYFDDELNLSSTKIKNMKEVPINAVFILNFKDMELNNIFSFKSPDHGYIIL
jgi:hypothetical protein